MTLPFKYLISGAWLIMIALVISTSSTFILGSEIGTDLAIRADDSFDPTQLSGNVLWLDASDIDGDGVAGGGYVDNNVWIDKSTTKLANAQQDISFRLPSVNENALNGLSSIIFSVGKFFDLQPDSFSMLRDVEGSTLFAFLKPDTQNSGQRVLMIATNQSQKT